MQQIFLALNLFAVCVLGLLTSFTDLRSGRISNRAVLSAIIAAFFFNALNGFEWQAFLLNGIIAFAFGFALFLARLWSPADSKLFLAYALLVPQGFYALGYIPLFPSLTILINTFVPAFVFLFAKLLLQTGGREKLLLLRKVASPANVFFIVAGVFGLGWVIDLVLRFFSVPGNFFLSTLAIFLLVEAAGGVFPQKFSALAVGALAAARLLLQPGELANPAFAAGFSATVASVLILFYFASGLGFRAYGRKVAVRDLKRGMVLLEGIAADGRGGFEKKDLFSKGLFAALSNAGSSLAVEAGARGLQEGDMRKINEWRRQGKLGFDSVLVQKSVAFAPLLFFGVVLTLLCGGSAVAFLYGAALNCL